MNSKACDPNPFVKLGKDMESEVVNLLDMTSTMDYLLTSKRTACQAEQKGWDFIIDETRSVPETQLPDRLEPTNLATFQQYFRQCQKKLTRIEKFMESHAKKSDTAEYWNRNFHCLRLLLRIYQSAILTTTIHNFVDDFEVQNFNEFVVFGNSNDFRDFNIELYELRHTMRRLLETIATMLRKAKEIASQNNY